VEFCEMLKELREKRDVSQREIAEALDVTSAAVSAWETGAKKPRFDKLQALADYFGVNPDYLMGGSAFDESYYINREASEIADFLKKRPEYKVLFDASRKVKPEDIKKVAKMIDLMGGKDESE